MRYSKRLVLCLILLLGFTACSQQGVAELMEKYLWEKRVLLVFSDSAENEHYASQQFSLTESVAGMKERDLVVWSFIVNQEVSVEGKSKAHLGTSRFYDYFNVRENGFTIILLGKDGEEKHRQNTALSMPELFSMIDAMPMRQREIRKDQ
ncbi:MAG: DUF4174 domain-containing protein [Rickettsiales bacterium]|nr:DUF4174 domain-containing protein [Rickettsiales bacterium]